jgi:hypothetical protein
MWDLERLRDAPPHLSRPDLQLEMIAGVPREDDLDASAEEIETAESVCEKLAEEAKQAGLTFVAVSDIDTASRRIIQNSQHAA